MESLVLLVKHPKPADLLREAHIPDACVGDLSSRTECTKSAQWRVQRTLCSLAAEGWIHKSVTVTSCLTFPIRELYRVNQQETSFRWKLTRITNHQNIAVVSEDFSLFTIIKKIIMNLTSVNVIHTHFIITTYLSLEDHGKIPWKRIWSETGFFFVLFCQNVEDFCCWVFHRLFNWRLKLSIFPATCCAQSTKYQKK